MHGGAGRSPTGGAYHCNAGIPSLQAGGLALGVPCSIVLNLVRLVHLSIPAFFIPLFSIWRMRSYGKASLR